MYFVLDAKTEATMAMCQFEDVAYTIAASLPVECVVRYSWMSNAVYAEHTNYFTSAEEKTA